MNVIGHQAKKGSYSSLRDVLMQDARTLVENLHRQDLTSIEEAEALKSLMDEQKYTQEQLGGIIGKAQGKMRDCALLEEKPGRLPFFPKGKWGVVPAFPGSRTGAVPVFSRFFRNRNCP